VSGRAHCKLNPVKDWTRIGLALGLSTWQGGRHERLGGYIVSGSGVLAGAAYLTASVAIFVFGSSYYRLFRTNRSWIYRAALPVASALAVWLCFQFSLTGTIRLLSIGFLAATTANIAGWAIAWLQRPLRISDDSMRGIALLKLLEALACRVS